MNRFWIVAGFSFLILAHSAHAAVEENYDPSKPRTSIPWFGNVSKAEKEADIAFITGMRPHHAGALTMSDEYLKNPEATNEPLKQLARGIIHNQEFEIGMLDNVQRLLDKISPPDGQTVWAQIATKGLAQEQEFIRKPMPGLLVEKNDVSTEDVRFAKAMIIHHQAALDMANHYLHDPNADNGYLRLLCQDILLDQSQEIAFMRSVIDSYKGDASAVQIDPSMVHGMGGIDHMNHGVKEEMHDSHHHSM